MPHLRVRIAAAGTLALAASPVVADLIYGTDDPYGGPFGLFGADVCESQSVAVRFTPDANYALDLVGVWFMNNDFSGRLHPEVTLTLRPDDPAGGVGDDPSAPASEIIEAWSFNVTAVGWESILEVVVSTKRPVLRKGVHYWLVAKSQAICGLDGVWNFAASGSGFISICNGSDCEWSSGPGGVLGTVIEGTPLIDGDLDADDDVDGADLGLLLLGWGPCPREASCLPDLNGDGVIDGADLGGLLLNWTG